MNIFKFVIKIVAGIGLGLLILASVVSLVGVTANKGVIKGGSPCLKLDRSTHDLGTVSASSEWKAAFPVRNLGDRRLILQKVNAGCDCIANDEAPVIINPGQCQTILVQVANIEQLGPKTLTLKYRTNDPQKPLITLTCIVH